MMQRILARTRAIQFAVYSWSRRRRTSIIWVTAVVLVVVAAIITAGAIAYVRIDRNIKSFDPRGLTHTRPPAAKADTAGASPENILVIGSDSRAGDNRRLGGGTGPVGRSDTTILFHVSADHERAVGVWIPRDTLVDIPPCRHRDGSWSAVRHDVTFNSAFSDGGGPDGNPACTQNTVEKLTGLRIDHTIVVDFTGFATMTEAVGGVEVCLPNDVYAGDINPNLGQRGELVFTRGRQKVAGAKALDYVRVRHGIGDGSDIGRIKRQQAFVASLIETMRSRGLAPATLLPLADAATRSLTVDPGLSSAARLMSFARSMRKINLHDITFVTVPWRFQGDRVALVQPDADKLWAALRTEDAGRNADPDGERSTATPTRTPDVRSRDSRTADQNICSNTSNG
jgi:LCP family protein required for cell wall assembly